MVEVFGGVDYSRLRAGLVFPGRFPSRRGCLGDQVLDIVAFNGRVFASTFEGGVIWELDMDKGVWRKSYDDGYCAGLWPFYPASNGILYVGGYSMNPVASGGIILGYINGEWRVLWAERRDLGTTNKCEVSSIVEYNDKVVAFIGAGATADFALVSDDGVKFRRVKHGIPLGAGDWTNVAGVAKDYIYIFVRRATGNAEVWRWDLKEGGAVKVAEFPEAGEPFPRPNVPLIGVYMPVIVRTSNPPNGERLYLFDVEREELIQTNLFWLLSADRYGGHVRGYKLYGNKMLVAFLNKAIGILDPLNEKILIMYRGDYTAVEVLGDKILAGSYSGWLNYRSAKTRDYVPSIVVLPFREPREPEPMEWRDLFIQLNNFINYTIPGDIVPKSPLSKAKVDWVILEPTDTSNAAATWAFVDYYLPNRGGDWNELVFGISARPTYVTYGGQDRPALFYPINREIPLNNRIAVLLRASANAYAYAKIRLLYGYAFLKDVMTIDHIVDWSGKTDYFFRNFVKSDVSVTSSAGVEEDIGLYELDRRYDIAKLVVPFQAWIDTATPGSFVRVYVSSDGVNWTKVFDTGDLPTSRTWFTAVAYRLLRVKYIRITANSASTGSTVTIVPQKAYAWV